MTESAEAAGVPVPSGQGDFAGLSAIVTGGASGLGLATAQLLASRGARVAALDVRPEGVPEPLLALGNAFALWRAAMREGRDARPFLLTLTFFVLGFAGLVLGIWPNIIPPSMSIWDAASAPSSQLFLGVGIVILLPAILGYTFWSYRVFSGKVAADSGYH